ncbi:2Fe-2S iron-sulfur cluster binding domain-containing protein [Azospirillum sp. TSO22-1]|uniref:2Fe-2S iron-sulfur cluster binding domain-containing protein n=1 Tax=Azospirillum sp. TSO22-1 TaxID=716789 RepID=UPI000D61EBBF|nr:2Fe-2S iron-sulfur cluster binding domain-containing protein [Azospirillum sp. TSO22-1]PWC53502.1 hypothetical protein TSO221_10635 [Azospirillum sp. TSO22-1]
MTAHTVRVEDAAGVILCQPGETIVAAMERTAMLSFRTGKDQPRVAVGCRKGGCGVCRVQVLDGAYRALPMSRAHVSDDDRRDGYVLACCVVPESDLAVRLAPRLPVRPTTSTTDIHANR